MARVSYVKESETDNPIVVLVHGYRDLFRDALRARSWRDRLRYALMPPGWSHDGPDKRASTLRREARVAEATHAESTRLGPRSEDTPA